MLGLWAAIPARAAADPLAPLARPPPVFDDGLRPLPEAVLRSYAAVLPRGEIALVETDTAGKARQITLLGYAAAPPATVHALVADPLRYPTYVRNLTRSDVERQADGTLLNRWRFSFPIGSFEGTDAVRLWPQTDAPDAAPGAVTMRSLGQGKQGRSRWEFLPVPGGGTLVVNYGYYDPLDNGFLRLLIGKDPAMDAGFNLAGGLALMRGLLAKAESEAKKDGVAVTPAPTLSEAERSPDFAPLLSRGTVAIVRAGSDGGLLDISVLERMPAPAPQLLALVRQPELWPRFLHMVRRVTVTRRDENSVDYDMAAAGLFTDVVTSFRGLFVPGGVDTLAVDGAIKGARMRWDIRPDGPAASVVVWRGNLHLADASRVLRAMLRAEPSFEYSANISVGLISVRSLAAQVR